MHQSMKKILLSLACLLAVSLVAIWFYWPKTTMPQIQNKSQRTPSSQTQEKKPLVEAQKLAKEIQKKLKGLQQLDEKTQELLKDYLIKNKLKAYDAVWSAFQNGSSHEAYVLALAAALDQFDTLFDGFSTVADPTTAIKQMISTLVQVDTFYTPIGGLLGYHATILRLLSNPQELASTEQYLPPPLEDMRTKKEKVWKACYEGTKEFARTAFIFPIGGASDRLNLVDEVTGEPLPAAAFVFCGKSLFEWLMRDVEAQAYWHYKTFGRQVTSPILLMTSHEKNNDARIVALGEKSGWFGHKADHFFRMVQPLVLLVDFEGKWVLSAPLTLALKPGGHGVIWKLAHDSGAFHWLKDRKADVAIVRQINNPLAGLDNALFTLAGQGIQQNKSFGFASCPLRSGFAEGMNILSLRHKEGAAISNIEYTHFKTLQETNPKLFENSSCPANTNILFVSVPAIEKAILKDPIPGMLVNPKTAVEVHKHGLIEKKMAARLESSMQNIADTLRTSFNLQATPEEQKKSLSTFLNLYDRSKLISVTKKAFTPGQSPYETPISCLYDWTACTRALLTNHCAFTLPPEQTLEQFIQKGPEFFFFFHPTLGPLWEVIGQKISHGTLAPGAEVELEIAEIACNGLTVDGSLRIVASHITGPRATDGSTTFSDKVGRARLKNCIILNKGVSSKNIEECIKGKQPRLESCEIILEGFSEVVAENITIKGDFHLKVPHGKKALLSQDETGKIIVEYYDLTTPSWTYKVKWNPKSAPELSIDMPHGA